VKKMIVSIPYDEFREYLVENDESGPWGNDYFHSVFDEDVVDGCIEIEYKYGNYKNGKSEIKWKVLGSMKVYSARYSGSSRFAMWWCGLTDGLEDEEEEE